MSDVVDLLNNEMDNLLNDYAKRRISDLEAKLAESEIRSKESEIFYKREINRRDTKLRNIKQQLSEKEKEIEIHKSAIRKTNRNCDTVKCQNKISFAVEQLEKVLKTLEEKQFFKKEDTAYCVHPAQIAEYIDNQIKQLKEIK